MQDVIEFSPLKPFPFARLRTRKTLKGMEFLEQLVKIDSQTKNREGVNQVQELVAERLIKMGFICNMIPNREEETGHLLYAVKVGSSSEQISFIGHADTVHSPTEASTFRINYADQTATGAGIGDDKGSLVMALEALETFFSHNPSHHFTFVFISSPCEETGSIGFHSLFKKVGMESLLVLGLEPALYNGSLISSRNGNRWYDIRIEGKAAHSGRFGEPAINAAHHASDFISNIHLYNDIPSKVKVNVGSLSGGRDRYNVVCDSVDIKLDTRFPDTEKRDQLDGMIKTLLNESSVECFYTKVKCQTSIKVVDDCPPLPLNKTHHPLLSLYVDTIHTFEDGPCSLEHSGGAADINYFARPGLLYIDGLGPKTKGMHTDCEVIDLKSFYSRQYAMTEVLCFLNQDPLFLSGDYCDKNHYWN